MATQEKGVAAEPVDTRAGPSPDALHYMTDSREAAALTRSELAMIRAVEAFSRWCYFLHKSVSDAPLSATDVWLLHSIRMRDNAQNLSELLLFLNKNEVSTLQYSLRKIEQCGLIERVTGNSRREAGYRLTAKGKAATDSYAQLRQHVLVELVGDVNGLADALDAAAGALERLTGLYDQSTQTVLNRKILSR
ncbi:MAG: winged helix DNA-binding protein [Sphingomonadaceae bacterium]